ncbi:MAG: hypothetical protein CMF01_11970 [Hyphomonas sp.]|uniref:TonB-dependent receptor domain-containing protein n=1 Tax=Hyphomonas sp. TaxID=87 RepID=UPI000C44F3CB|nr:hypothetical protein [Hyphomonas sp.]
METAGLTKPVDHLGGAEHFITHKGEYGKLDWDSYINYDISENETSDIKYEVLTLNTQAVRSFGDHTLTGGLNHKEESLENGPVNSLNPDTVLERYHSAAFLEDYWALTDDLAILLSGRYDNNENFGDHFSPKIYAVYSLTDNWVIKGGVTSGFKVAKLADAAPDYAFGSRGGARLGNPSLKPEESLNKEVGITYDNKSQGLNATLTAYQTDYENKLVRSGTICEPDTVCVYNGYTYEPNSSGYTTTINLEEAETRGVEHTLDYKILDNLTYRHNYTYTKTEFTLGDAEGVPLRDNPEHMFNASLYWDPTSKLTLWSQVNWRGETSGAQGSTRGAPSGEFDPDTVHDAYAIYDVGLNYRLNDKVQLNAGVYNIENKLVTTEDGYSSTLDGRHFVAGATFRY